MSAHDSGDAGSAGDAGDAESGVGGGGVEGGVIGLISDTGSGGVGLIGDGGIGLAEDAADGGSGGVESVSSVGDGGVGGGVVGLTSDAADTPGGRGFETILTRVIVTAVMAFLIANLRPWLWVLDTTPTGGDLGAHVWAPSYLRDVLLGDLRLTGWTQDWYAGFPAFTFYMVIPSLLVVIVEAGLSLPVAFFANVAAFLVLGAITQRFASRSASRVHRVSVIGGAVLLMGAIALRNPLDGRTVGLFGYGDFVYNDVAVNRFMAAVVLPVVVGWLIWSSLSARTARWRDLRLAITVVAVAVTVMVTPLPYNVAFKLVAVAGVVLLPVAAYTMARVGGMAFPGPALAAVATLPFLFDRSYNIYGGNLMSTMAGEFAYSLGLMCAVLYIGVALRGMESGRHQVLAGVLLALTGLTHLFSAFLALAATGALLVILPWQREALRSRLRWTVMTGALAAALSAWWVLPFWWNQGFLNDMGWGKDRLYESALWSRTSFNYDFLVNDPPLSLFVVLAAFGAAVSIVRRVRLPIVLAATAAIFACLFVVLPEGRLWNVRILPFYYLTVYLTALLGLGEAARAATPVVSRIGAGIIAVTRWPLRVAKSVHSALFGPAEETNLSNIVGSRAAFSDATGSKANLSNITRSKTEFSNVTGSQTGFSDATELKASLSDVTGSVADLSHITRSEADLSDSAELKAGLSDVTGSEVGLSDVTGSQTGFSDATRSVPSVLFGDAAKKGPSNARIPTAIGRGSVAVVVASVIFVMVGLSLRSLPLGAVNEAGAYAWGPFQKSGINFGPSWLQYNYEGYELKQPTTAGGGATEYEDLVSTMTDVGHDYGCGVSLWEFEGDRLGSYGTPMAPMLLPYWTDRCIGSMEGLYFEASATTPYHFLMQSELSAMPSRAQRDLPYSVLDVHAGVRRLRLMGVRYYLAFSEDAISQARVTPGLQEIASSGPWTVFLVNDSDPVVGLSRLPVVVDDLPTSGDGWLEASTGAFLASDETVLLAPTGPDDWPRLTLESLAQELNAVRDDTVGLPGTPRKRVMLRLSELLPSASPYKPVVEPATVSEVVRRDQSISFSVDRVGSPVLVRMSYFPNWSASGADGPYRVTPNLMVVVPTNTHVELSYGRSTVESSALLMTLGGIVAAGWLAWTRRPSEL